MITQYRRILDKATDLVNMTVDHTIEYLTVVQGYKLKSSKKEIIDDYVNRSKILFTSVVPDYSSPYEEEAIELAMSLNWDFRCYTRSIDGYEQFKYDKQNTKWGLHWKWDIAWPSMIKDVIIEKNIGHYTTAFIGYRMDESIDMTSAKYSGTSVDASEFTKMFCTYVSDKSFNNFAFSDLLLEIVSQDIKNFIQSDESCEKYFEKN